MFSLVCLVLLDFPQLSKKIMPDGKSLLVGRAHISHPHKKSSFFTFSFRSPDADSRPEAVLSAFTAPPLEPEKGYMLIFIFLKCKYSHRPGNRPMCKMNILHRGHNLL